MKAYVEANVDTIQLLQISDAMLISLGTCSLTVQTLLVHKNS